MREIILVPLPLASVRRLMSFLTYRVKEDKVSAPYIIYARWQRFGGTITNLPDLDVLFSIVCLWLGHDCCVVASTNRGFKDHSRS